MKKPEREEDMENRNVEDTTAKKRRVEGEPRRKFLGEIIRGYELEEPIDWKEERRKRKEALDKEEKKRQDRI